MFFRRISRMKRREKEYKNLKMKGASCIIKNMDVEN